MLGTIDTRNRAKTPGHLVCPCLLIINLQAQTGLQRTNAGNSCAVSAAQIRTVSR